MPQLIREKWFALFAGWLLPSLCSGEIKGLKAILRPALRRIYADRVFVPAAVDERADLLAHLDLLGPRPRALVRALRGRVDPELAAEELVRRRVIEVVERALADDDVPTRVDVGPNVKEDLLVVVHVHVLVDDHDRLRQAEHPEPPDRVHHFLGVAG